MKPARTRRILAFLLALVVGLLFLGMTCQPRSASIVDLSPPDWTRDAVGYQVFVRSFADSNGDGVGDLKGLISRLDYLNDGKAGGTDLEVNLLYLMPLHPSPSYHGYDVTDYRAINPEYGSLEDFRNLCKEAHQRGMRVIMDWVLNHSSIAHPWFEASVSSNNDAKRDWYIWRDSDPGWTRPWGGGPVCRPANGSRSIASLVISASSRCTRPVRIARPNPSCRSMCATSAWPPIDSSVS